MNASATIAIIGKPNVGKSTLFNRIIGKRYAITADIAGTTRDRIFQKTKLDDTEILLVDTGGLEFGKKENIEADVQTQANIAIQDADLILFLIDLSTNLTTDDFTAASLLRKSKKPTILIANKADNHEVEKNIYDAYELGLGEAIKVSAIHKTGIEELKLQIKNELKKLPLKEKTKKNNTMINLCILGKPNAGKSSLVNAFLGEDKLIVSEIPGTTRDSNDIEINYQENIFNLTDTAGLRRRGKIEKGIEKYSTLRSLNAVEKSDIVVLLMDGNKGITAQDCHIVESALEEKKGLILVINKIDLIDEEKKEWIIRRLRRRFLFVPWAPVVFVSAKNKKNINEILNLSIEISKERKKRINTAELNSFLQKITQKHLPTSSKMQKPRFMYGSQVDIAPPKFTLFFKRPENLHFTYSRYLENEIRKEYGFTGTSIELIFKGSVSKKKET